MDTNNHYDAIIIGAGPAGLTAGIYLSRSRMKTLIVNEGTVGDGTVASLTASGYLNELKVKQKQLITI